MRVSPTTEEKKTGHKHLQEEEHQIPRSSAGADLGGKKPDKRDFVNTEEVKATVERKIG